ncbi:23S rRNA-intervening sequence protein [Geosporobacter subterraneus DSM 17957]|uniref:23S rRNA-intervening sequence protein n=1 Tax=Geosporobacter subterraneus DSM 17957 TaxID=1121919 RepID=A0A1M6M548_9FIRM|nr:four helix bundle protein [Geosporobacter subterraneus]SHJ78614.1 23S rRNA-intervening sequence protein [Geosporobacter subterraneus DSM 17957]
MGTRRNYQRKVSKNDNPLQILPVAADLIDYTLNLTDNKNHFPKKIRFTIVNRIQERVLSIYEKLLEANEIFPIRNETDRIRRLELQRAALADCKMLLFYIELSRKRGYIDKGSFEYWTKKTLDVKFMSAAWYKAEQEAAEKAASAPEENQ